MPRITPNTRALLEAVDLKIDAMAAGPQVSGLEGLRNPRLDEDIDFYITFLDPSGDLVVASELTAGTCTIDRIRSGATTTIVNAAANSKVDGRVFYTHGFPTGTWVAGDVFRVKMSGVKSTIDGETTELPDKYFWGRVSEVGDIATDVQANRAHLEHATYGLEGLKDLIVIVDTVCDNIQNDLDNGTDGLGALKGLIDAVQADLDNETDGLGAIKGAVTGVQMDLDNTTDGLGALKALLDRLQTTVEPLDPVPVPGAYSQWYLGGIDDLRDYGVAGNDGTMNGSGAITVPGVHGEAIRFAGAQDVSVGTDISGSHGGADFSMRAWVRKPSASVNLEIVCGWRSDPAAYINEILLNSNGTPRVIVKSGTSVDFSGPDPVDDGNWHDLVLVRDYGSTVYLYVDGELANSAPDTAGDSSNAIQFRIGASSVQTFDLVGDLDTVEWYDHALTADQVSALYRRTVASAYVPAIKMRVDDMHEIVSYVEAIVDDIDAVTSELHNLSSSDVETAVYNKLNQQAPAAPTAGSLLDILSSGSQTFDKSTDSLEAIRNAIDSGIELGGGPNLVDGASWSGTNCTPSVNGDTITVNYDAASVPGYIEAQFTCLAGTRILVACRCNPNGVGTTNFALGLYDTTNFTYYPLRTVRYPGTDTVYLLGVFEVSPGYGSLSTSWKMRVTIDDSLASGNYSCTISKPFVMRLDTSPVFYAQPLHRSSEINWRDSTAPDTSERTILTVHADRCPLLFYGAYVHGDNLSGSGTARLKVAPHPGHSSTYTVNVSQSVADGAVEWVPAQTNGAPIVVPFEGQVLLTFQANAANDVVEFTPIYAELPHWLPEHD